MANWIRIECKRFYTPALFFFIYLLLSFFFPLIAFYAIGKSGRPRSFDYIRFVTLLHFHLRWLLFASHSLYLQRFLVCEFLHRHNIFEGRMDRKDNLKAYFWFVLCSHFHSLLLTNVKCVRFRLRLLLLLLLRTICFVISEIMYSAHLPSSNAIFFIEFINKSSKTNGPHKIQNQTVNKSKKAENRFFFFHRRDEECERCAQYTEGKREKNTVKKP